MDEKTAKKVFDYLDKINNNVNSYREEIIDFTSGAYNRMDAVFGELKTTREEQSFLSHRTSELEDRVEVIEKVSVIAHSIKK